MSRPSASRQRYRTFVQDYKQHRLDDSTASGGKPEPPVPKGFPTGKRREYLRDYLRWLKPHRVEISGVFVLALLVAGLEMIEPLFMRFIIDRVLLNTTLDTAARLSRLHLAGGVFVSVIVVSNLVKVLKDYRQKLLNQRVMLSLRQSLFDRLLHLPLPRLWDMKTGGILSRLTGDVDTTTGLLQMAVISPTISLIRLIVAVTVLMVLNWRLALTALAIIPGVMVMSFAFTRRVRPIYRSVRKDAEVIDGRVGETFSGIRVVRAFARETRELFGYMLGRHTVLRKELFAHRRELIVWTSWGLLTAAVNVVIIWYGGYLNVVGRATIGDIMAFQWYTFLLMGPVWNIVNSFSELQRSLAAMERVFEVLAMENDKPDRPDARPPPRWSRRSASSRSSSSTARASRSCATSTWSCPADRSWRWSGAAAPARRPSPTWWRASTIPRRGRILLNGTDIRDFRLNSYRSLLALVQQDVFLFDGSARDNIAYGRKDATDAEVEDAARRANAHEFIVRLPEQYATFIGERGVKLSGGQQQRLAIARAVLAQPQILILDEATSNLDTESEQLIQASMADLLAGRTTFVIAHRLSTIRRADLILLMEDGRVIERGTHTELMSAGGTYYKMVKRQMEFSGEQAEVNALALDQFES